MGAPHQLRIAEGFTLGDDFVTKTAAIVAQRRKGKTYTACVIAEELVEAGLPWVALDPTGAWWGMRASADGKSAGLPVVVLGGSHGDAPLERSAGRAVADLVVEHPGWYVLDLSLFESKAAEREFSADFAEALYRRKGAPGRDFPLHLFVDEADMFVPQDREQGDARMLGAFQSIVRRGGLRGLGTTLISQRPALVNKSVLVQLDMLIVLRLVAGNDQDYVKKNYFERAGTKEQVVDLMASMARLALGEAWIWEPGEDVFERRQIRERRTFNSSITPKPGEKRIEPQRLADVDLDAVKEVMATAIAKAKADDPRALRRRVKELEDQLANIKPDLMEPEVETVYVERLPAGSLEAMRVVVAHADKTLEALHGLQDAMEKVATAPAPPGEIAPRAPRPAAAPKAAPTPALRPAPPASDVALGKGERAVLTAVAQHGPVTREQLTVLLGYKKTSRNAYLQRLAGLVEQVTPGRFRITPEGEAALGDYERLPTGAALRGWWLGKLGGGEQTILGLLIDAYPAGLDRESIGEDAGYQRSSRNAYIQRLRARGLVVVAGATVTASPTLFGDDE
jgi:hypothetical protein